MFKKLNKKGFTLAELLVVVAIIGVLVAISIPIFTSQLEKARDAVSVANLRAAYAEAATKVLTEDTLVVEETVTFKGQNSGDNYSGLAAELPFTAPTEPVAGDHKVTFTWTKNSDAAPTVTIS